MNLRQNLSVALMAAALCVMAPVAVPVGPIPVTLATLGVYLAAALLGPWRGAATVGLYLLLGGIGLPVFAGFSGGFAHLFGTTGGFLWGYIPCVVVAGLLGRIGRQNMTPVWLACGMVVLYAVGGGWFAWQTHTAVGAALLTVVLPGLSVEWIKIAAVTALIVPLRKMTAVGMRE